MIRRLVEKKGVRPTQFQSGQRDARGFAAAHGADRSVERDVSQADARRHCRGALRKVPVVANEIELFWLGNTATVPTRTQSTPTCDEASSAANFVLRPYVHGAHAT